MPVKVSFAFWPGTVVVTGVAVANAMAFSRSTSLTVGFVGVSTYKAFVFDVTSSSIPARSVPT